jgi:Tfp pilus assembly protein PilX
MNNNKITKRDIIEGMGFILMVVSIITLLCALYELNEVNTIVKELRITTNRK